MFDFRTFRTSFSSVDSSEYICFDNAATTQKPDCMIHALSSYYGEALGSAGRGQSPLSERASEAYFAARTKVMRFIGAQAPEEIIFTYGATDALNMLANSFRGKLNPQKNIVISSLEHNANYLPWKHICDMTGAELRIIEPGENGIPDVAHAAHLIDENTLLLSVTAASNVTGGVTDTKALCALAHKAGAQAAIDASQLIAHSKIDINDINCDYLVFSAHKVYGPEGLGVLYRRSSLPDKLEPFRFGGGMAEEKNAGGISILGLPEGAEAGTHNTAGAVAFAAVADFLSLFDSKERLAYTRSLADFIYSELSALDGISFVGYHAKNLPVMSMVFDGFSPSDADIYLAMRKICVRSGKHCAFLPVSHLAPGGTLRVSLAPYNTAEEAEKFVSAIKSMREYFGRKKI